MAAQLTRMAIPIRETAGVDRTNWPVSGGVPFAMGLLTAPDRVHLVGPNGEVVPCQTRALSRWPDGSVRWLLVHFQANVGAQATATYFLELTAAPMVHPEPNLVLAVNGEVKIDTGSLSARIRRRPFALLDEVRLGDLLLCQGGADLVVEAGGETYRASLDPSVEWEVLESGPLRAAVRIAGRHLSSAGRRCLDFSVVVRAFAGLPWLELDYTFTNREEAAQLSIDHIRMEFPLALGAGASGLCGAYEDMYQTAQPFTIVQDRPGHMHGIFRTARIETAEGELIDGPRPGWQDVTPAAHREHWEWIEMTPWQAKGWVDVSLPEGGVTFVVREFAQMHPKRLKVDRTGITLDLWPREAGPFTLYQGQARTHTVLLAAHEEHGVSARANRVAAAYEAPLVPLPTPQWQETRVFGDLFPFRPEQYPGMEAALRDEFYSWYMGSQCFGMMDYGDYMQVTSGPRAGFMGNNEHDTIQGLLLQYVRTGELDYLTSGGAYARHVIDVDVIHHSTHSHEVGGVRAHGQGHLLYEKATTLVGEVLTSVDTGHQWVEGLLSYYALSGDERALQAARGIGDCLVRLIDLGWTRPEPGPRNSGWPLIALTALYEFTGETRYLEGCRRIVSSVAAAQRPEGYWTIMLGFAPAFCPWQNTVLLTGLGRFHQLTGDSQARALFLTGMRAVVELGRHPDGAFMYIDAPDYRWSYYSGLTREPFGYAYHLTGEVIFLKAALHRANRWFWATDPGRGPANGNHISAWRGHMRFLYWADRAGLLKDLDY